MEHKNAARSHLLSETEERLIEELANTGERAFERLFEETVSNAVFEWNGQPASHPDTLRMLVARTEVNATVKMSVIRDGETLELEVVVGERPSRLTR